MPGLRSSPFGVVLAGLVYGRSLPCAACHQHPSSGTCSRRDRKICEAFARSFQLPSGLLRSSESQSCCSAFTSFVYSSQPGRCRQAGLATLCGPAWQPSSAILRNGLAPNSPRNSRRRSRGSILRAARRGGRLRAILRRHSCSSSAYVGFLFVESAYMREKIAAMFPDGDSRPRSERGP